MLGCSCVSPDVSWVGGRHACGLLRAAVLGSAGPRFPQTPVCPPRGLGRHRFSLHIKEIPFAGRYLGSLLFFTITPATTQVSVDSVCKGIRKHLLFITSAALDSGSPGPTRSANTRVPKAHKQAPQGLLHVWGSTCITRRWHQDRLRNLLARLRPCSGDVAVIRFFLGMRWTLSEKGVFVFAADTGMRLYARGRALFTWALQTAKPRASLLCCSSETRGASLINAQFNNSVSWRSRKKCAHLSPSSSQVQVVLFMPIIY